MTVLETKLADVGSNAIDILIDLFSVHWVVRWLVEDHNFTKEDLLACHFDEEDLDYVLEGNYNAE